MSTVDETISWLLAGDPAIRWQTMRDLLDAPEDWRPRIDRLAALCEESRQLEVQMRLHRWLHGWLFVHAPISFALFVLTAFHIWFALSYKPGG